MVPRPRAKHGHSVTVGHVCCVRLPPRFAWLPPRASETQFHRACLTCWAPPRGAPGVATPHWRPSRWPACPRAPRKSEKPTGKKRQRAKKKICEPALAFLFFGLGAPRPGIALKRLRCQKKTNLESSCGYTLRPLAVRSTPKPKTEPILCWVPTFSVLQLRGAISRSDGSGSISGNSAGEGPILARRFSLGFFAARRALFFGTCQVGFATFRV